MNPRSLSLAVLSALCLGLAACGGGNSESAAEPETGSDAGDQAQIQAVRKGSGSGGKTNRAPKISGTPVQSATAGVAYSFRAEGKDVDGNKLTYSVTNKPVWASFDSATGTLAGTPPSSAAGTSVAAVTISVSDGSLSASLPPFGIEVFASAGNDQPSGIYALDLVVDKPFVDGVAVRPKWSDMEPAEGVYDFSKIDKAVRDASAVGQKVTIASLVNFAPDWLIAKTSTFLDSKDRPTIVPWDETMLKALEKLVNAQAAHTVDGVALRDHPAVRQVNASIGGITSIRFITMPKDYSADKLTAAVDRSIAIWAKAYPKGKHLYVGLFSIADKVKSPSTAEVIRDRLLKTYNGTTAPRLHFFQELLTGQTPQVEGNLGTILLGVGQRAGVMFQACGPWTAQGSGEWSCKWTPSDSPEQGMKFATEHYGSRYFEFYRGDLDTEAYRSSFESWHTRIEGAL